MIPFHSFLALADIAAKTPMFVAIACGVILLIAFLVGLKKGFRRVCWGGMFWLFAAVAFFLLDFNLADKLPLKDAYAEILKAQYVDFAVSMTIAIAVVIVTLVLQLLFNAFLRPRIKYVKRKTRISYDGYGFEYEEDGGDFDDEYYADDYYGRRPKKVGYGKPRAFTRIMGGIACMLNTAIVLAIIVSIGIFLVDATKLYNGAFGEIFKERWVSTVRLYARSYVLDFISIGILLGVSLYGYKRGFAATMRVVIIPIGGTAAFIACGIMPFLKVSDGDWYFLSAFVKRCVKLFDSMENCELFGRILAAVLMCILSLIVFFVLGKAFNKLVEGIKAVKVLRVLDSIIGCAVFLAIGFGLCTALWSVLYTFEYCGLFYASNIFNEYSSLANGFYEYVKVFIDDFADTYLLKYA